ncbi:MAG: UDP-glucose/GDP-mannose dehydrogenase family protein [SAR202 cluster bacterium]|nr:UDP-glucose/GDP-mannose dehydrogenase family protein [SAR202 cluster bacterium]
MKVSVIGLGYVGSVAAAGLAKAGHDVLGIDVDAEWIESYRNGRVPIFEPNLAEIIHDASDDGKLQFSHVDQVSTPLGDAILVATGTPTNEDGTVDLRPVETALSWIKKRQPGEAVIVMKSTVAPGTGERVRQTLLNDTAFNYVSNPEFLREGLAIHDWFNPDRIVVGGDDQRALETVKALYRGIDAPYVITDITSAEMIKYASNAFLATKISFINEIAALSDRLGATIDDVSRGMGLDPRIGASFLKAGVGYGGSCLPKDVKALVRLASANGEPYDLVRSVMSINDRQRLLPLQALRDRLGQLSGVKIGVLGLSFKPETDDVREAPSIDLVRAMVAEGASVCAFDPEARSTAEAVLPSSAILADDVLQCTDGAQAVVLMTEWPEIVKADWRIVADHTEPPHYLFDGRNALDPVLMQQFGFEYQGVGRGRGRAPSPSVEHRVQAPAD